MGRICPNVKRKPQETWFSRKNQRFSSEDITVVAIFIEHEGIEST